MYVCIYICKYVYIYIYVSMYIYIYVYAWRPNDHCILNINATPLFLRISDSLLLVPVLLPIMVLYQPLSLFDANGVSREWSPSTALFTSHLHGNNASNKNDNNISIYSYYIYNTVYIYS